MIIKKLLFPLLLIASLGYAQDIQKGVTFSDGMTVHGADLNNAIDNATILPTFYSAKGNGTPLTSDNILFYQGSTSTIKKVTLADLLTAGHALDLTTTRTANFVLAGPATGSAAAPTFRLLSPYDLRVVTETAGGSTINCSTSTTFSRTLSANTTYTLSNMVDGQVVTAAIKQAASGGPYTATFSGVTWKGGVAPTQTNVANKVDLYTFIKIGTPVYGSASQNY